MNTKPSMNNIRGFTLVELMVVVLLTAIAVIAIYRGYTAFSHSADAQEQIIEMQQNLRIGMYWLEKDIRRAGMTEEDNTTIKVDLNNDGAFGSGETRKGKDVTFLTAGASRLEFGMDLGNGGVFATDGEDNDGDGISDNDPDPDVAALEAEEEGRMGDDDFDDDGERITYRLVPNGDTNDLQRGVWATASTDYLAQTIITNVDALNFVYLDEDGADLDPDDPRTTLLESGPTSPTSPPSPLVADIRSVEVAIVVRTTNKDLRYRNNEPYRNLQDSDGDGNNDIIYQAPGDNFRRRLMVKRIKVRNAGL